MTIIGEEMIERVARAIVVSRGGNPDECVHGFSWAAGEMGKVESGSVCHRRAWQDRIVEAKAAIDAMDSPEAVTVMREALEAVKSTARLPTAVTRSTKAVIPSEVYHQVCAALSKVTVV